MKLLRDILRPPTVPEPAPIKPIKPIKPPRRRLMSFGEFCRRMDNGTLPNLYRFLKKDHQ